MALSKGLSYFNEYLDIFPPLKCLYISLIGYLIDKAIILFINNALYLKDLNDL